VRPSPPCDRSTHHDAFAYGNFTGDLDTRSHLLLGEQGYIWARGAWEPCLLAEVALANSERVFVTSLVDQMNAETRASVERLRTVRVLDDDGNLVKTGVMGFGTEPNPDAADGTEVATVADVTRRDERS
jgi:hypothetical protein